MAEPAGWLGIRTISKDEEAKLGECAIKDIKTFEIGIDVLKEEYKKAKASDTTHEDEIREFRKKIKAIIGSNDLSN